MVDQTPVLDIKPYIPQYDNPSPTSYAPTQQNPVCTIVTAHHYETNSTNSVFCGPVDDDTDEIENASGYDLMNNRIMDGEENGAGLNHNGYNVPYVASNNSDRPDLEESLYSRYGNVLLICISYS